MNGCLDERMNGSVPQELAVPIIQPTIHSAANLLTGMLPKRLSEGQAPRGPKITVFLREIPGLAELGLPNCWLVVALSNAPLRRLLHEAKIVSGLRRYPSRSELSVPASS